MMADAAMLVPRRYGHNCADLALRTDAACILDSIVDMGGDLMFSANLPERPHPSIVIRRPVGLAATRHTMTIRLARLAHESGAFFEPDSNQALPLG